MAVSVPSPRIAIYGTDETSPQEKRGCALWPAGYAAAMTEAGGSPVWVELPPPDTSWEGVLQGAEGLLFLGHATPPSAWRCAAEEKLCLWCQGQKIPLLAVDHGLHVLNTAFGGTLHMDLPKELPTALQHQHLPEKGDRHAINVVPGSRICQAYGEGEIVVNSEHRRALNKVARGFRVSASALDGVVEGVEWEADEWFGVGVQWQPASASASGLDIQLFRSLVDACHQRHQAAMPVLMAQAA